MRKPPKLGKPVLLLLLFLPGGCGDDPVVPPDISPGTFEARATGFYQGEFFGAASAEIERQISANGIDLLVDELSFEGQDPGTGISLHFLALRLSDPRLGKGSFSCSSSPDPRFTGDQFWGDLDLYGSDGEYGHFFTPSCEVRIARRTEAEVFGTLSVRATGFLPVPGDNPYGDLWFQGPFRATIGG
jgi:hypothetical protein